MGSEMCIRDSPYTVPRTIAGIIGNQVRILSDPVTVSGKQTTLGHCESEKAWCAATRKSGNLLCVVWIGIFRRK